MALSAFIVAYLGHNAAPLAAHACYEFGVMNCLESLRIKLLVQCRRLRNRFSVHFKHNTRLLSLLFWVAWVQPHLWSWHVFYRIRYFLSAAAAFWSEGATRVKSVDDFIGGFLFRLSDKRLKMGKLLIACLLVLMLLELYLAQFLSQVRNGTFVLTDLLDVVLKLICLRLDATWWMHSLLVLSVEVELWISAR